MKKILCFGKKVLNSIKLKVIIMFLFISSAMTKYAYADTGDIVDENSLPYKILKLVVGWGSVIGLIILVITLIKDIAAYIKQEVSIGKVVMKVLFIFLLIGLMVVTLTFNPNKFSGVLEDVVDSLPTEALE